MAQIAAGTPTAQVPQIKDAGVLALLKAAEDDEVSPGSKVGLQQLRLCDAGPPW